MRLMPKPTGISCAVKICHTDTATKLLVKTGGCIADSGRALISCKSEQIKTITVAHWTVVIYGDFKRTFRYADRWFSHLLMLLLLLWQLAVLAPNASNPWCNMLLKIALHICGKASASSSVQWKSASFNSLENLRYANSFSSHISQIERKSTITQLPTIWEWTKLHEQRWTPKVVPEVLSCLQSLPTLAQRQPSPHMWFLPPIYLPPFLLPATRLAGWTLQPASGVCCCRAGREVAAVRAPGSSLQHSCSPHWYPKTVEKTNTKKDDDQMNASATLTAQW